MHHTADLPPVLASVAEGLARTGWAVELFDAEFRLQWLSPEMRRILREEDPARLGYGEHSVAVRFHPAYEGSITPESAVEWFTENAPRMAPFTPGGLDAILAMFPAGYAQRLGTLTAAEPEMLWAGGNTYRQEGLPPARTRYLTTALHDADGELTGWMTIFGGAIPASLLAVVARGSQAMFRRMAELVVAGRHETAIMFCDIQASSQLARRVSTARFFEVIREFSTFADETVIRHGGIVGRHAGDGATAFFLAEQCGSRAAACAGALRTAREIVKWRPADLDVSVNAGVHWGGALYLGQVVTGGRLEVTALGDEVNECARIQQSARNGTLLASKAVVERLEDADAADLGIDPLKVVYRTVGELPGVDFKAVRDAGGVSVMALR